MRLLTLTLGLGLLLSESISFSQSYTWEELTTSPTSLDINAASFINKDQGWIVCDAGDIWYTPDGGLTWEDRRVFGATADGYDIQFLNDTVGWACGALGVVLRTTDGGESWEAASVGAEFAVEDIHMINTSVGYASGHSLTMYQDQLWSTTDGGATWTEIIDSPENLAIYGVHSPISDPDVVIGCGKDNLIGFTNDGGLTWTQSSIDASGTSLPDPMAWEAVHMVNGSLGYAVGWGQHKALTFDGGATWLVQAGSGSGKLKDVEGYGSSVVMICGTSGFSWTEDGGTGWNSPSFSFPADIELEGISIPDDETAYIVGNGGVIYKSPASSVDLVPESYVGPTDICGEGLFPISVVVKNDGSTDAATATCTVNGTDGSELLSFDWTGSIEAGTTQEIYLGKVAIDETGVLQIIVSGDDVTDNNTLNQPLNYLNSTAVGAESPVIVCEGELVELNAFGGTTYDWLDDEDAFSDPTIQNPTVSPTSTTTYTVAITDVLCYGSFEVLVEVLTNCDEQPTAFSPNGDGTNDYFHLSELDMNENNEFRVFNRWGAEIRYIQNYDNESTVWSGRDNELKDLPSGTYYYTYRNLDTDRQVAGWIALLR